MRNFLLYVLLSASFCYYKDVRAQPTNLVFEHFTADNGLPQNSVNCIMQDSQGFIWIGTQDGLCRYDGYQFKIYQNKADSKNSLSNNYVWHIAEDKEGIIWIATFGGGVNRFDPETEKFTHFMWEKGNPNSVSTNNTFYVLDGGKVIWVGTNDGFCSIEKVSGNVQRFLKTSGIKDGLAGNYIGELAFKEPDVLWLTSDSGLTQYNLIDDKIEFLINSSKYYFAHFGTIDRFKKYGDDFYLIDSGSIFLLNKKNEFRLLLKTKDVPTKNRVAFLGILPNNDGTFWINSNQGLIYLNNTGVPKLFVNEPGNPASLANNNILSILRSRSGVLWLGTRGGLEKLEHVDSEIKLVKRQSGKKNTMSHSQVSGIAEDDFGRIWMGTAEGVNVYNREKDEFYVFRHQPGNPQSITQDYILSLLRDSDGNFWAGTKGGGINKIIPDKQNPDLIKARVVQYYLDGKSIQHICEDNNGILWLGSSGGSLIKFNSKTGSSKNYVWSLDSLGPSHPYVFYVFKDSFQNLWLGTATGGLNLFNPEKERFLYIRNNSENKYSLSNDLVISIVEDSKHQLWVGTTGGLNKLNFPLRRNMYDFLYDSLDLKTDSLFTIYTRQDGLPNDLIYGILEDNQGHLWISTNKGIVKFDPSKPTPVLKMYDISNGLQSNEFNQNAFYKNKKGEMFFGGIGGLNIFNPDRLKGNTYVPPVYITDFKLFNSSVPLKSDSTNESFYLEKAIHKTNRIELEYKHDVITFDFVALNYINPEKNQYQYKLEGFIPDWIDAGSNRSATFTNLDAGTYVFKVRASNDDGVWNETGTSLTIVVPPPPWLSWWAFLFYFIIAVILLYIFIERRIKIATRRYEMEAEIERARVEARENFRVKTSQDFHDEAGNKITKINLFIELAKTEKGEKYKEYLEKIAQNTRELSVGMRDLIWALDPEKDTLTDTLLRLKEFGESIFVETGSRFEIIGMQQHFSDIKLNMDTRRAIMLIYKEAMNNAAKYARASRILIIVDFSNDFLSIELKDDGIGFETENPDFNPGYGTKNMHSRAEKIGAELNIKSEINKGTSVLLKMHIPQMSD
ncbi:MAG TPA: two-component regulator propeller domain-containing protein [Bacteroidales bacterium]